MIGNQCGGLRMCGAQSGGFCVVAQVIAVIPKMRPEWTLGYDMARQAQNEI